MKNITIPLNHGLSIGLMLIFWFYILGFFGVNHKPLYLLLFLPIMFTGMYSAFKSYKQEKTSAFRCEKGYLTVFFTGLTATCVFTLFFSYYGNYINTDYTTKLYGDWGYTLNNCPTILSSGIFLIGIAITMMICIIVVQLFKENWSQ